MVITIISRNLGFAVIHVQGNGDKVLLSRERIDLRGDDVQEPKSPSLISEVVHSVRVPEFWIK